ncbi:hypothetical protein BLNAU_5628 [Blattamonas nauphoetae]|uniref:Uncharacterized protein n=1 Tax=Blattamonas nauphoetae TaxID=2049346 RepID=A0ABQ9Y6N5_9EUKA|nr:hypothetical protein BLNAU_5628 [Blattamonas nauphoetae]
MKLKRFFASQCLHSPGFSKRSKTLLSEPGLNAVTPHAKNIRRAVDDLLEASVGACARGCHILKGPQ